MRIGSKAYRKLQGDLDQVGITTKILRIGPKWYEVHVNYEISKKYTLRKSANNFLKRLHRKHCSKKLSIQCRPSKMIFVRHSLDKRNQVLNTFIK